MSDDDKRQAWRDIERDLDRRRGCLVPLALIIAATLFGMFLS